MLINMVRRPDVGQVLMSKVLLLQSLEVEMDPRTREQASRDWGCPVRWMGCKLKQQLSLFRLHCGVQLSAAPANRAIHLL